MKHLKESESRQTCKIGVNPNLFVGIDRAKKHEEDSVKSGTLLVIKTAGIII